MDLIQKCVLEIDSHDDDLHFDLEFTEDKSSGLFDEDLYNKLNQYKQKIDEVDKGRMWDFCKKLANECELIHQCIKNKPQNIGVASYDPISRAYFKMWEICKDFDLIDMTQRQLTYGALAEGPGGFIECFHSIRRKYGIHPYDRVYCMTLKPTNNEVPGWKNNMKFMSEGQFTITYGEDDTGDLYKKANIKHFASLFADHPADLITGDGGFDFSEDYSNQEMSAFQLIFCEMVTGMMCLRKGGSMVLKMFDMFQMSTIDLLYIVCRYFNHVYLTKPNSSRTVNSEKYLVCKGFRGMSSSDKVRLLDLVEEIEVLASQNKYIVSVITNIIPDEFVQTIHSGNVHFTAKQIHALIRALCYIQDSLLNEEINEIKKIQTVYSLAWCKKYDFPINYRCRYLREDLGYNFVPNY